ncbi:hypothetical protein GCM10009676_33520 [Prauserella halophila]|uniref:Peptidoglycan hydrolase-like protein with peptidoglycan-binding domain n=1 Tax=Prauserella halophila TaxID=185641 RepID=A0ABN1WBW4_9PSEU|nr:peptidoglycan-binding protein [Prauserella halophila]MCP2238472.1 Peptidoglycan-binding (PGRP) domain of peptidoglycan hydrolases-containing protein [Prauserella halophila]
MKNLRPVTRRSMLRGSAAVGMAAATSVLIPTSAQAGTMADTQRSLKGLYYYRGVIDGHNGPMTTSAVKDFQSDRGLEKDGYAGPVTQGELAKVVKAVQSAVGVGADGDYGPVTESAVKKFQSSEGLSVDGYAGAKTMAALGVQRKKSASVADTQRSLKGLYYYRGVIDGHNGPMTTSAVKDFQSDRGLEKDGYAGPVTQGELAKVVKAVQSAVGVGADGDYGPVTESAVKKFQSSEGLSVDGYAGAKTMAALGVQRKKGSDPDPDPGGSGDLIVINQMATGPMSDENCGPTSAVITLYALGRPPSGSHKQAVMNMREACQIPADTWGADVKHLIRGLGAYDTNARKVNYASALAAAADGKPVILNVNHGVLLGGAPSYGHYVVARGTNSAGDFYVSDPGRASFGIKLYTRSRLEAAARYDRGIIVG